MLSVIHTDKLHVYFAYHLVPRDRHVVNLSEGVAPFASVGLVDGLGVESFPGMQPSDR